ncbi:MAG: 6-phosphogluconolactonase [Acetobacteraceae bacterium]
MTAPGDPARMVAPGDPARMVAPGDLARMIAEWMIGVLGEAPGPLAVALSGGSTPKQLYELLVTPGFIGRVPWDRVHWFWGDERFVPHDDERSNYRMTRRAMLDHAPVPPQNIHPIPTENLTPEAAASAYQTELQTFRGNADLAGPPLFQLVLLGLGTNGHTASLFPDTEVLAERTAWAAAVTPPGEPTRITLTYPALESCRHAAFLVAGAEKRDVLARVRAGDNRLPAARYRPTGLLRWFADDAAAGVG